MMQYSDCLKVMQKERECVLRARERNCNQGHCAGCDLVLPDDVILNAYDSVIEVLKILDDDLK